MRDNWIGNTELQKRLLCANPTAHEIVEAVVTEDSYIIDTVERWGGNDSASGSLSSMSDGGVKLGGDGR